MTNQQKNTKVVDLECILSKAKLLSLSNHIVVLEQNKKEATFYKDLVSSLKKIKFFHMDGANPVKKHSS